jgi:hypothetical protein
MFARKSQGKQKGEGNRLKIDKNSDKTRVVGFIGFTFFIFKPKFSLFKNISLKKLLKIKNGRN